MAIRMTGMISGLDTDAIVQELMAAQNTKKQKVVNSQTKLTWQQEIWKELNTKLYSFYTGSLNKLKTQGSFLTKKVTSSNESAVTATANINAPVGAHSIKVNSLARSQYITGGKLQDADGNAVSATKNTTLASLGIAEGTVINVKSGDNEQSLTVDSDTTINDFLKTCQEAGLTASFDTTQQRFFISSAGSGTENAFSITTGTALRVGAEQQLNTIVGAIATDDAAFKSYASSVTSIKEKLAANFEDDADALQDALDDVINKVKNGGTFTQDELDAYGISEDDYNALRTSYDAVSNIASSDSELQTAIDGYLDGDVEKSDLLGTAKESSSTLFTSELTSASNILKDMDAEAFGNLEQITSATDDELEQYGVTREQYEAYQLLTSQVSDPDEFKTQMATYIADDVAALGAGQTSQLTVLGLDEIDPTGKTEADDVTATSTSQMSMVWATDAQVLLDGAIFESSTNDFTINGITLNLKSTTSEAVQLNVSNDTSAVYDMIKTFINDYNAILKEMTEKYNAASARGYDPLTDDQKSAMTDDEIEKWETKIKDSLLRRDDTLNSLMSTMRTAMMSTIKIDGKTYSLSSLGITTSSDYTEGGLLHIHGDADDDTYASENNVLNDMLESNPDVVMQILTSAASSLYQSFQQKMAKTSLSSALTFYNDVQMTNQQRDYATEISKWNTKLATLEERYYSQFTAMEKALASLQSQSGYFASLMGTS